MKTNEKRLLFVLLALVVLAIGVVSFKFYIKKRDDLRAEKELLEGDWLEMQVLFEKKEQWDLRANWLKQNQPSFTSEQKINEAIFDLALAKEVPGVTTQKHNLIPVETTDDYVQAGVSFIAKGKLPDVFRWLYDLTRPESFYLIRNLKVAPDKEEEGSVIAQIELLRWYAPPTQ